MRRLLLSSVALSVVLTCACARQDETATPPEPTTASAPEQRNQPMTVTGCLRAGEAANTFVLTAAGAEGAAEPATYELVGASAQLADHIGERVEVTGRLAAAQDLRSSTSATEADKAKGTTGTPVVETQTKVEMRRLEVSGVKPISSDCKP